VFNLTEPEHYWVTRHASLLHVTQRTLPQGAYPFCKATVATAERVKDLIGRFMVEEKVSLLVNNAAAVPRLEIKGFD